MRSSLSGFTMIEVVIATTVIGLLLVPVSMVILQFYGQALATSRNTQLAIDSRNTLSVITENLRTSSAIMAENTITDPNAPSGGWKTSSAGKVLVIATPAFNKTPAMVLNTSTGKYYQDEIVFYVTNKELRRRYLANGGVADNKQVTTCPPATSTSTCPPDLTLSRDTNNFSFILYDTSNAVTTTPSNARSIQASTELLQKIYGRDISYRDTALVALRNIP